MRDLVIVPKVVVPNVMLALVAACIKGSVASVAQEKHGAGSGANQHGENPSVALRKTGRRASCVKGSWIFQGNAGTAVAYNGVCHCTSWKYVWRCCPHERRRVVSGGVFVFYRLIVFFSLEDLFSLLPRYC